MWPDFSIMKRLVGGEDGGCEKVLYSIEAAGTGNDRKKGVKGCDRNGCAALLPVRLCYGIRF